MNTDLLRKLQNAGITEKTIKILDENGITTEDRLLRMTEARYKALNISFGDLWTLLDLFQGQQPSIPVLPMVLQPDPDFLSFLEMVQSQNPGMLLAWFSEHKLTSAMLENPANDLKQLNPGMLVIARAFEGPDTFSPAARQRILKTWPVMGKELIEGLGQDNQKLLLVLGRASTQGPLVRQLAEAFVFYTEYARMFGRNV